MNHCDLIDFWLILCPPFSVCSSVRAFFAASLFFSGGARPREGAARLAGSRAGARSSVVGREEDEDGRASGTGFGFAVGEGRFWVRDPFSIRDSNHEIGLAFAYLPLETV